MTQTALLDREEIQTVTESPQTTDLQRSTEPPAYRPDEFSPGDLPLDDPDWPRLDAYREEAWRRGIDVETLTRFENGYCSQQVNDQINHIKTWLWNNPE